MTFDKLSLKSALRLYAITDAKMIANDGFTLRKAVEKAILGGATIIQLREKNISFENYLQKALAVKQVTDKYDIPLIINDNIDVAVACDAGGVHLGQEDENISVAKQKLDNNKIIGISANSLEEAIEAEQAGADYLGIDTPFATKTKKDQKLSNFKTMKEICKRVKIPCVAIGGINTSNVMQIADTGIDGIAVISAIFSDKNIEKNVKDLLQIVKQTIV